ncbi:MAG TPA: C39 family peptidase [Pseudomonadales bacterium]
MRRPRRGTLLLAAALGGAAVHPAHAAPLSTPAGRLEVPIATFKNLREARLVRQGWDISCGAAALSTILTHHFGDPYSEATIAVSILYNTDPERVRARGGFSLLDLKRFAEAVGYVAAGYRGLTLDDLAARGVPAILPVRIRDYDHFVVFRGRAGNRVLVGDPAFGNLTLTLAQFHRAWTSGIGFFVFADAAQAAGETSPTASPLAPDALSVLLPNLDLVYRLSRAGSMVPTGARVIRLPSE